MQMMSHLARRQSWWACREGVLALFPPVYKGGMYLHALWLEEHWLQVGHYFHAKDPIPAQHAEKGLITLQRMVFLWAWITSQTPRKAAIQVAKICCSDFGPFVGCKTPRSKE